MYAITWETYNQVSPASSEAFIDYYAKCQIDKLKQKGVSAAEIDLEVKKMSDFKRMYGKPAIRFGITLMEILPVGIIITLISAAVLRKKEFLPA
jgi:hypothetical protein